jgi:hypothetical protein
LYKGIGDGQNGHGGKPPWHVTNDRAYFSQRNEGQASSPLFHVGTRPRETGSSKKGLNRRSQRSQRGTCSSVKIRVWPCSRLFCYTRYPLKTAENRLNMRPPRIAQRVPGVEPPAESYHPFRRRVYARGTLTFFSTFPLTAQMAGIVVSRPMIVKVAPTALL